MEKLIRKYCDKLVAQRMANPGEPLMAGIDDEMIWSRRDPAIEVLTGVFGRLNINSMLHCRPAEPYGSIVEYLAARSDGIIRPKDSETRTFLHDLPVTPSFDVEEISASLKKRKSVISAGGHVTTFGTVSPEEAYIAFSSVCFACYVKFLSDCLADARKGRLSNEARSLVARTLDHLTPLFAPVEGVLARGPFADEEEVHLEMIRAGRVVVQNELVDSYFGNISYLLDDVLHISQTGSSLDELAGCIDPCPLDGSSSVGITASSELSAHMLIVERTGKRAILHGHPRYAVIISLDCDVEDCPGLGRCHLECARERFVKDVPIVPGEVGTGRWGLCKTVPEAMAGRRGVIVYGHGLFTAGTADFTDAMKSLFEIEQMCRDEYLNRIG